MLNRLRSTKVGDSAFTEAGGSSSTGINHGQYNTLANIICPQRLLLPRISRDTRQHYYRLVNGNTWNIIVAIFTIISLFANDASVLFIGSENDPGLTIVLWLCFIVFIADFIGKSTFDPKYVFSFFFWLDFVSTVSLGLEFVLDSDATGDILLARTARATRAGARLPRMIRLIKLIRMLRVLKLWQVIAGRMNQSDSYKQPADKNAATVEFVCEHMTVLISRKVVLGVLIVIAIYSLLETETQDTGAALGMDMLYHQYKTTGDNFNCTSAMNNFLEHFPELVTEIRVGNCSWPSDPDVVMESKNPESLCIFEVNGTIETTDDENCNSTVYATFNLDGELADEASSNLFQTLVLVLFVLGWSIILQHDIQKFVIPMGNSLQRGKSRKITVVPNNNTTEEDTMKNESSSKFVLSQMLNGEKAQNTSKMKMLLTCLVNISTSFTTEPELQKAIEGVMEMIRRETQVDSSLYNPIVSTVIERTDFKSSSHEVRRWVYRDLLQVPNTTLMVLTAAARKKLGVEFVNRSSSSQRESEPAGDFLFKTSMVQGSIFGTTFEHSVGPLNSIARKLEAFDFDVFQLETLTENRPLTWMTYTIMMKHNMMNNFTINEKKLLMLLSIVECDDWISNPYHNNYHSADIVRSIHWYLTSARLEDRITKIDALSLVLAGLFLNYHHTGRTNRFEVETQSQLSVVFGEVSILERYALAGAFTVLNHESASILESMNTGEWRTFRQTFVNTVVSRDTNTHMNILEKLQITITPFEESAQMSLGTEQERQLILIMILKAANIGHVAKSKAAHLNWTERIFTEFFALGDEEAKHDIPISPFCDRENSQIGHAQVAFFEFVVIPFFNIFSETIQTNFAHDLLNNIDSNYMDWKKRKNIEQGEQKKKITYVRKIANKLITKENPKVDDEAYTIDSFRSSTRFSKSRANVIDVPEETKGPNQQVQDALANVAPFDLGSRASVQAVSRAKDLEHVFETAINARKRVKI